MEGNCMTALTFNRVVNIFYHVNPIARAWNIGFNSKTKHLALRSHFYWLIVKSLQREGYSNFIAVSRKKNVKLYSGALSLEDTRRLDAMDGFIKCQSRRAVLWLSIFHQYISLLSRLFVNCETNHVHPMSRDVFWNTGHFVA